MGQPRFSGSGSYGTKTVSTTAVQLSKASVSRVSLMVQNIDDTNDVYVGMDDSVTADNGLLLAPGDSVKLEDYAGNVWVIASASTDVRYFEVK